MSINFITSAILDGREPINNDQLRVLCANHEFFDITKLDTFRVTSMEQLFDYAVTFNQDISAWDTRNVKSLYGIFWGAKVFNQDISSWDTTAVKNMSLAFYCATSFQQDISNWNTSSLQVALSVFDRSNVVEAHKPRFLRLS